MSKALRFDVCVEILQQKVRLSIPCIIKVVGNILRIQKVKQAKLSLVFVTQGKIRTLNRKYLKRFFATDVLAFDFTNQTHAQKATLKKIDGLDGEIIISIDAALKQSKMYDAPLEKEITLYIIHGILHLQGYDDHRLTDVRRMRKKEEELLNLVGKRIERIVLRT